MIDFLTTSLGPSFFDRALFHYITFRAIMAFFTSFFTAFFVGPLFIRTLKSYQKKGQPIRDDGPQHHITLKQGTPTMGGIFIVGSFLVGIMLWGALDTYTLWHLTLATLGFGAIGFIDDFLKLTKHNHHGLSPRKKIIGQTGLTFTLAFVLWSLAPEGLRDTLHLPFFKNAFFHLSYGWILWAMLVLIGSANAVNLTDGLDGLAVGPSVIATAVLVIIAYLAGHKEFSTYLYIPHIPGVGEALVLGGALIGGCLGFLWYNAPPAMVFMGDTGSMAIGGFLGALALLIKHEMIYALVGGVFVLEALSVMVQVLYFKKTRKRVFLMAPLHHHFEHKGWSEPTIVMRFWIISLILGILALASLKVR